MGIERQHLTSNTTGQIQGQYAAASISSSGASATQPPDYLAPVKMDNIARGPYQKALADFVNRMKQTPHQQPATKHEVETLLTSAHAEASLAGRPGNSLATDILLARQAIAATSMSNTEKYDLQKYATKIVNDILDAPVTTHRGPDEKIHHQSLQKAMFATIDTFGSWVNPTRQLCGIIPYDAGRGSSRLHKDLSSIVRNLEVLEPPMQAEVIARMVSAARNSPNPMLIMNYARQWLKKGNHAVAKIVLQECIQHLNSGNVLLEVRAYRITKATMTSLSRADLIELKTSFEEITKNIWPGAEADRKSHTWAINRMQSAFLNAIPTSTSVSPAWGS